MPFRALDGDFVVADDSLRDADKEAEKEADEEADKDDGRRREVSVVRATLRAAVIVSVMVR